MDKSVKPRGRDLATRLQVEADLEKQKKILKSVKLSALPDNGAKIKDKIEELQNLLETLTLEFDTVPPAQSGEKKLFDGGSLKVNPFSIDKELHKVKERPSFPNTGLNNVSLIQSSTKCDQEVSSAHKKFNESVKDNTLSTSNGVKEKHGSSKTGLSNLSLDGGSIKSDTDVSAAFSKAYGPDILSFEKLSRTLPVTYDQLDEVYQSPSFKSFRNTKPIPSIKLTDAKPLFEATTKSGKACRTIYSAAQQSSALSEEAVQKLQHVLAVYPEDGEEETPPRLLDTPMMPHQVQALSWMVWREGQQPSGGILADDMGLGKTLTLISLILKQKEEDNFLSDSDVNDTQCTLVVCLASILHQWNQEIEKHCRHNALRVLVYHGPKRERSVRDMRKHDVVLTTYSTLLSERKGMEKNGQESGLFVLKWQRIVLDEAHSIKNHTSQTAEAVFALRGFRHWCVTGTPIHNNLQDMYSLIKFLRLAPFDDHKKWKKLTSDDTSASRSRTDLLVKSILLRRTKEDKDKANKPLVAMAKKMVSVVYFELSEEERRVYDRLDGQMKEALEKYLRKSTKKVINTSSNLLVMLLRLQQCCSHVSLLGKETAEEEIANNSTDNVLASFSGLTIGDSSNTSGSDSGLDLTFSSYQDSDLSNSTYCSTKLQRLFNALAKIAEESNNTAKSVIVSQWVSMLDIVAEHLDKEGTRYHKIAGSTKVEDRQAASNDFNNNAHGHKIMLLSLKAGGVGLNLVGASHLFLLDLHWNPALERQACDRIHRVGQKKDVFIHKFVCKDTIEEKILALQNKKSDEASDVLQGGSRLTKGLSMEDFRLLFNISL